MDHSLLHRRLYHNRVFENHLLNSHNPVNESKTIEFVIIFTNNHYQTFEQPGVTNTTKKKTNKKYSKRKFHLQAPGTPNKTTNKLN